jgi:riboflavin transporter FmnP
MNTTYSSKNKLKLNAKGGKLLTVRTMAVIGMMAAVATVLMLFELPLWFAPPFYKLDFSEVPVLVGAFALGPVAGILIELAKVLLNLIINGTVTAGIGEFANFLIGCSLVVPAAIIYHRKKSFKSALIGMIVGTVIMVFLGSILNALVLLPAYSFFTPYSMADLINMGTQVNPAIQNITTFVLFAVAPFNLLKSVAVSIITMLLYKQISTIIKAFTK